MREIDPRRDHKCAHSWFEGCKSRTLAARASNEFNNSRHLTAVGIKAISRRRAAGSCFGWCDVLGRRFAAAGFSDADG